MCTTDFYEGQGRMDGAFCDFTEAEKMEHLQTLKDNGVVNIEMESLAFAALTHHAGVKAAVVCVTLLDRLKSDQVRAKCLSLYLSLSLFCHSKLSLSIAYLFISRLSLSTSMYINIGG